MIAVGAILAVAVAKDAPGQVGELGPVRRLATFNVALYDDDGALADRLSGGDDDHAHVIAEIIQRVRPDVLLVNEFDYDADGAALRAFLGQYLGVDHGEAQAIDYPYRYVAPLNTGVPSGHDLDNNGEIGDGRDAFGFGRHPGQYGMAVLSRYPIERRAIRSFRTFLWKDMPGALLPDDPDTDAGADWYTQQELAVVRLSSKSHWDVPIDIDGTMVHFLVSHPTPPVFDGPEDRNGKRNFDEIGFWADYIDPGTSGYIYDDDRQTGGLTPGERFVIAGDLNADPNDGRGRDGAIAQLLDHRLVNASVTPSSGGGAEQAALQGGANARHKTPPHHDTGDFRDDGDGVGNLRVDYVLPSRRGLVVVDAGVYWPTRDEPTFELVRTYPFPGSDHRLVWIDVRVVD